MDTDNTVQCNLHCEAITSASLYYMVLYAQYTCLGTVCVLWEPHFRLVFVAASPALAKSTKLLSLSSNDCSKDDHFLLMNSTIRTANHTAMDIIASAEAAPTLAGMFLEIVKITKHVIETMRGARTASVELFTRAERIRLNLELFRSLANKLSDPMEKVTALSFDKSAWTDCK